MDISYLPVGTGYNLFRIDLDNYDTTKKVDVRQPVNHIWIFDRSGSMTGTLSKLIDDLISQLDHVADGDTLSVGWFSTQGGEYEFLLVGASVMQSSRKMIKDTLNKYRNTVGLTCFSEILEHTSNTLLQNLDKFPGTWSMMFLTDGYPVVNDRQKEISSVMKSLGVLSSKLSSVLFVGYGDYYNKELMAKMTQTVGGMLIHSSHIKEFSTSMESFVKDGSSASKRIPVPIPTIAPIFVYGIENGNVVVYPYEVRNSNTAMVFVPENAYCLYVLTSSMTVPDLTHYRNTLIWNDKDPYAVIAGASYIAMTQANSELAVELLNFIGDVYLIDIVNNAWTNEEYGNAQEEVINAIRSTAHRFVNGERKGYVPRPDAFCLLDALDLLMEDDKAFFYPRLPGFVYKRIGAKTITRDGYPDFTADATTGCPLSSLTWNSKRLNLSVLAKINGIVVLPDDCTRVGLSKSFHCHQWRNYTIVKDGILNVDSMPISCSEETYRRLASAGMIDSDNEWKNENSIITVRFDTVPLVNKVRAQAPTAVEYCEWLNKELQLEYDQKFLKKWLEDLDPSGVMTKDISEFSPQQEEYLHGLGIKPDRTYSPPVDTQSTNDQYNAYEFEVKIKNFSSAPKVDDVLEKMSNGPIKPFTPSQRLMADVIEYHKSKTDALDTILKVKYASTVLETVKEDLKHVRGLIQSTRFAVLLCKRWFPDLSQREGAQVSYDDKDFTFSIREVLVDY